ncbi:MAG: hypothetical protein ABSD10_03560 [Candidatus Saccharimonadales bacterium]
MPELPEVDPAVDFRVSSSSDEIFIRCQRLINCLGLTATDIRADELKLTCKVE